MYFVLAWVGSMVYNTRMNDTITYTVTTPKVGLTQLTFANGYVLSIGAGTGHYASWLVGNRYDREGSQHIPTSYEVAVLAPNGSFIPLTSCDDVAGFQSLDTVQTILGKMERDNFNPKDLELFCE